MTKMQKSILGLIQENKTLEEIKKVLNLDDKRLLRILQSLKSNGYEAIKEYQVNGEVLLKLKKEKNPPGPEITQIKDSLKIGVMAENHFGSIYERIDYIEEAINYCEKNDIHYIINGGDFVDGLKKSRFRVYQKELEYALKSYPTSSITTFLTLGDHDVWALEKEGYDIARVIESTRTDIIPIGYEKGRLKLKNENIGVLHKKSRGKNSVYEEKITLIAHGHRGGSELLNNHLKIYIPPCSDIIIRDFAPGFLILDMTFNNEDDVEDIMIRRMIFSPTPIIGNEDTYHFQKKK